MADAFVRLRTPAASAVRERSDLRLLSEMDQHVLRDLAAVQSRVAERRRAGARYGG